MYYSQRTRERWREGRREDVSRNDEEECEGVLFVSRAPSIGIIWYQ